MTKQGKLGIFLGCVCFLPVWLVAVCIAGMDFILGTTLAIGTQVLWVISIALCTWDLKIKNRQLIKKIKKMEGKE
jgi:uncharacterized membrane protein YciS (DUF1049 family)